MKKLKNNLSDFVNQNYKYGFTTKIEKEDFPTGLNEKIIELISEKKEEPLFLLNFRKKAFKKWKNMKFPLWTNLEIKNINFNDIKYYSIPKKKKS